MEVPLRIVVLLVNNSFVSKKEQYLPKWAMLKLDPTYMPINYENGGLNLG